MNMNESNLARHEQVIKPFNKKGTNNRTNNNKNNRQLQRQQQQYYNSNEIYQCYYPNYGYVELAGTTTMPAFDSAEQTAATAATAATADTFNTAAAYAASPSIDANCDDDDIEIIMHDDNTSSSCTGQNNRPIDLKGQLEYYFSRQNLVNDKYLASQMDSEYYVPISVIAGFKRVREWTTDIELIVQTLKYQCLNVILDETETKVKPKDVISATKRNTVIFRDVPECTKEEITNLLEQLNSPPTLSIKQDFGNMWYFTFDSEQDALQLLSSVRGQYFKDQLIAARMKSEPILTVPFYSSRTFTFEKKDELTTMDQETITVTVDAPFTINSSASPYYPYATNDYYSYYSPTFMGGNQYNNYQANYSRGMYYNNDGITGVTLDGNTLNNNKPQHQSRRGKNNQTATGNSNTSTTNVVTNTHNNKQRNNWTSFNNNKKKSNKKNKNTTKNNNVMSDELKASHFPPLPNQQPEEKNNTDKQSTLLVPMKTIADIVKSTVDIDNKKKDFKGSRTTSISSASSVSSLDSAYSCHTAIDHTTTTTTTTASTPTEEDFPSLITNLKGELKNNAFSYANILKKKV